MSSRTEVDRYVLDTLMRDLVGHDHRTSSYLVFLFVLGAGDGKPVVLSHQQLADGAGLAKRTVQDAVAHLVRRGYLAVERRGPTEPATLRPLFPWQS